MKTLQVRLWDDDYAELVELAGGTGKRLSAYCRQRLLAKDDPEPEAPVPPAVQAVEEKIAALPRRSPTSKAAANGFAPCKDCSSSKCVRFGFPSCPQCQAAAAKNAPSAAETFQAIA